MLAAKFLFALTSWVSRTVNNAKLDLSENTAKAFRQYSTWLRHDELCQSAFRVSSICRSYLPQQILMDIHPVSQARRIISPELFTTQFLLLVIYYVILWTRAHGRSRWMYYPPSFFIDNLHQLQLPCRNAKRASALFLYHSECRTGSHLIPLSLPNRSYGLHLWGLQRGGNVGEQDLGCVVGGEEQSIRFVWLLAVFSNLCMVVVEELEVCGNTRAGF